MNGTLDWMLEYVLFRIGNVLDHVHLFGLSLAPKEGSNDWHQTSGDHDDEHAITPSPPAAAEYALSYFSCDKRIDDPWDIQ